MEKINVNSFILDSVVDGPGVRSVIFFQGCSHKCQGCHNKDSWSLRDNKLYDPLELFQKIDKENLSKKVTISGGEPFLQKEGLLQLVKLFKSNDYNIYIYTGFLYEQLKQNNIAKEIFNYIDVLVDGKFEIENLDNSLSIVGSTNQKIIHLNKNS